MPTPPRRCDTCACWQPPAEGAGFGECHHSPPQPPPTGQAPAAVQWPKTLALSWCHSGWRPHDAGNVPEKDSP